MTSPAFLHCRQASRSLTPGPRVTVQAWNSQPNMHLVRELDGLFRRDLSLVKGPTRSADHHQYRNQERKLYARLLQHLKQLHCTFFKQLLHILSCEVDTQDPTSALIRLNLLARQVWNVLSLGCKRSGRIGIPGTQNLRNCRKNNGQCIQDSSFLHYME